MKNREFTPEELLTIASYNRSAETWAKSHSSIEFWSREFAIFRNYLPAGRILEIGSGGGRDAKLFIGAGYDYIGTDVSEELLNQARNANPDGIFLKQSVYDLIFPKGYFDGFWASAVLLHIPKTRLSEALRRINSITRKSGIGFISIKEGVGEKVEEEILEGEEFSRLFAYFSDAEFADFLYNNGFDILRHQRKPMSEKTIWLTYFVQTKK